MAKSRLGGLASLRGSLSPNELMTLIAIAVGAAGIGFGGFLYAVPYSRVVRELKRREGEVLSDQAELSAQRRELEQIKHDLVQTRGPANSAEVQWRSSFKVISANILEKLADAHVTVALDGRRMLVSFPEDSLFEGHGPSLTRPGQAAIETVAQLVGDRAGRMLVSAPMGAARVPRWAQEQYPTPAEFSAARVKSVVRVLTRHGADTGSVWGVTAAGPSNTATGTPTLDIEVQPKP